MWQGWSISPGVNCWHLFWQSLFVQWQQMVMNLGIDLTYTRLISNLQLSFISTYRTQQQNNNQYHMAYPGNFFQRGTCYINQLQCLSKNNHFWEKLSQQSLTWKVCLKSFSYTLIFKNWRNMLCCNLNFVFCSHADNMFLFVILVWVLLPVGMDNQFHLSSKQHAQCFSLTLFYFLLWF